MWKFLYQFSLLVQSKNVWDFSSRSAHQKGVCCYCLKATSFYNSKFRNNVILDYYCTVLCNTELYVRRQWAERKWLYSVICSSFYLPHFALISWIQRWSSYSCIVPRILQIKIGCIKNTQIKGHHLFLKNKYYLTDINGGSNTHFRIPYWTRKLPLQ